MGDTTAVVLVFRQRALWPHVFSMGDCGGRDGGCLVSEARTFGGVVRDGGRHVSTVLRAAGCVRDDGRSVSDELPSVGGVRDGGRMVTFYPTPIEEKEAHDYRHARP